jgi:hypothetical protein
VGDFSIMTCLEEYPHFFKWCFDYSIPLAWEPLIKEFCQACGKQRRIHGEEIQIVQVKEKFGEIRIYYHPPNLMLDKLVDNLEFRSWEIT